MHSTPNAPLTSTQTRVQQSAPHRSPVRYFCHQSRLRPTAGPGGAGLLIYGAETIDAQLLVIKAQERAAKRIDGIRVLSKMAIETKWSEDVIPNEVLRVMC